MDYLIVKVDKNNYTLFDDMVFFRINGRDKNEIERTSNKIDNTVFDTLEDKNLYIYAAQIDNKFIGWISFVYLPKVGRTNGRGYLYIDELWVNSDYRNKGIGYALMEKGEIISEELNTLGLRLYVNMDNNEALSLYKKIGYVEKGSAFFMEKEFIK